MLYICIFHGNHGCSAHGDDGIEYFEKLKNLEKHTKNRMNTTFIEDNRKICYKKKKNGLYYCVMKTEINKKICLDFINNLDKDDNLRDKFELFNKETELHEVNINNDDDDEKEENDIDMKLKLLANQEISFKTIKVPKKNTKKKRVICVVISSIMFIFILIIILVVLIIIFVILGIIFS